MKFSSKVYKSILQVKLQVKFTSQIYKRDSQVNFTSKISKQDHIIFDPQTSGGLLVSVNKIKANQVLEKLKKSYHHASIIGEVIEKHEIILN